MQYCSPFMGAGLRSGGIMHTHGCRFPHVIDTVHRFTPSEWADLMEVESGQADENGMTSPKKP